MPHQPGHVFDPYNLSPEEEKSRRLLRQAEDALAPAAMRGQLGERGPLQEFLIEQADEIKNITGAKRARITDPDAFASFLAGESDLFEQATGQSSPFRQALSLENQKLLDTQRSQTPPDILAELQTSGAKRVEVGQAETQQGFIDHELFETALVQSGVPPSEAHQQATAAFGGGVDLQGQRDFADFEAITGRPSPMRQAMMEEEQAGRERMDSVEGRVVRRVGEIGRDFARNALTLQAGIPGPQGLVSSALTGRLPFVDAPSPKEQFDAFVTPVVRPEDVGFVPDTLGARRVAEAATQLTSFGDLALTGATAGLGPAIVRGVANPVIRALAAPIVKGGLAKRLGAETAAGIGAVIGFEELAERAPDNIAAQLGLGLVGGLGGAVGGIGAYRGATEGIPAAVRAGGRAAEAVGQTGVGNVLQPPPRVQQAARAADAGGGAFRAFDDALDAPAQPVNRIRVTTTAPLDQTLDPTNPFSAGPADIQVSNVFRNAGRDIVAVQLPDGTRQGFYKRTGGGGPSGTAGSGAVDQWVPFDGITVLQGDMWFDKARFASGAGADQSSPLYRTGSQVYADIGKALDEANIPVGRDVDDSTVNRLLGTPESAESQRWMDKVSPAAAPDVAGGGREAIRQQIIAEQGEDFSSFMFHASNDIEGVVQQGLLQGGLASSPISEQGFGEVIHVFRIEDLPPNLDALAADISFGRGFNSQNPPRPIASFTRRELGLPSGDDLEIGARAQELGIFREPPIEQMVSPEEVARFNAQDAAFDVESAARIRRAYGVAEPSPAAPDVTGGAGTRGFRIGEPRPGVGSDGGQRWTVTNEGSEAVAILLPPDRNGKVVGSLVSFKTDPAKLRQGFGEALVKDTMETLRVRGATSFEVYAESAVWDSVTRTTNQGYSPQLFAKLGLRETGRKNSFGDREMVLDLTGRSPAPATPATPPVRAALKPAAPGEADWLGPAVADQAGLDRMKAAKRSPVARRELINEAQEANRQNPGSVPEEVAEYASRETAAPDGGPPPPPPPKRGSKQPPEADPSEILKRARKSRLEEERFDQRLLIQHEAAIANAERQARIVVNEGNDELLAAKLGGKSRGTVVPRNQTDIDRFDNLLEALNEPSRVRSGELTVEPALRKIYDDLRADTDFEQAARIDFDPEMATVDDYFYRGWKPPEMVVNAKKDATGKLVTPPDFTLPRVDASYREMRNAGFEPLFWNPYEQARLARMQGVKYRQQMELVEALKELDDDIIRPKLDSTNETGFRVPEIGPAFEGKPFALTPVSAQVKDVSGGGSAVQGTMLTELKARRWIVRNDVANLLETMYGKKPSLGTLSWKVGTRTRNKAFETDILKVIDWLVFIPKRIGLFGTFFQQLDFLTRAGFGSFGNAVDLLARGKPIKAAQAIIKYPQIAAEILAANVSATRRRTIMEAFDSTKPLIEGRNVSLKSISDEGLSVRDVTIFPEDMDVILREAAQDRSIVDPRRAGRAIAGVERAMRAGLFQGVYPAAVKADVENNIAPQMARLYGDELTDAQLSARIAKAANIKYSTIPASQSALQNRFIRETTKRGLFSVAELEGLLRQATNTIKGPGRKYWAANWLGGYIFLMTVANIIHTASTGKILPLERYSPVSKGGYGPLPIGYNTRFAAPTVPGIARGGLPGTLDIVGQMDTAFRVLDPKGFVGSRFSIPVRAAVNQWSGEDFFERPINDVGPGGVISRTTALLLDMFSPFGAGPAAEEVAREFVPGADVVIPRGESRLGLRGLGIQALGINLRSMNNSELASALSDTELTAEERRTISEELARRSEESGKTRRPGDFELEALLRGRGQTVR